ESELAEGGGNRLRCSSRSLRAALAHADLLGERPQQVGRCLHGSRVFQKRSDARLCLAAVADELKPAYLIAGSDRPKVDRAVARLRARFDQDAVELHDAAETTGDDAVAACNALGLFGGGDRLIVVNGVEAWKADDAKAVAAYVGAPSPGTVLALVGSELKKDGPLAKAVGPAGEVLVWDAPKRGLDRWVAEQFKLRSTTAEPEACRLL